MSQVVQALRQAPNTTRFINALLSRLLPLEFSVDTGEELAPALSLSHTLVPLQNAAFVLYINMNGLWRLSLGNLDLLALRPEFADYLDTDEENSFASLPEPLIRATLERLFLPLLDLLSKHTQIPGFFTMKPRQSSTSMFQEEAHFLLHGQARGPICTQVSLAWQDQATLEPMLQALLAIPPKKPAAYLMQTLLKSELVLTPCLGSMRLLTQELYSLRCGDILLNAQLSPKTCLLIGANLAFTCIINGNILEVQAQASLSAGGHTMSDDIQEASAQTPLISPDQTQDIELDVAFTLPSIRLKLGDCIKLTAGTTFSLAADIQQLPIHVMVGGQKLAEGRLVDVGGTLGVQLTQVQQDKMSAD